METIRAYTTIEQSRKLAEILPIESADMRYSPLGGTHPWVLEDDLIEKDAVLCWSLAALLNYLKSKNKFPDIKELSDGRFKLTTFIWDGKKSFQVFIANNLVDACYKLVLKLHECEML